ncbi:MAG: hypothetical protein CM1200mP2_54930 [Planctomycetaceae bacterium]|nr:MAG: hypothetical protein CM1200mP2_54930 [Planctomycetaceae bacterium]
MKTLTVLMTVFALFSSEVVSAREVNVASAGKAESLLKTLLQEKDDAVRERAVEALVKLDNSSTPLLLNAFRQEKKSIRQRGVDQRVVPQERRTDQGGVVRGAQGFRFQ